MKTAPDPTPSRASHGLLEDPPLGAELGSGNVQPTSHRDVDRFAQACRHEPRPPADAARTSSATGAPVAVGGEP